MRTAWALAFLATFASSCVQPPAGSGGVRRDDDDDDRPRDDPSPVKRCEWELERPEFEALSPGEARLGDRIEVFGRNFVPTECGTLRVELDGTYTEDDGDSRSFRGEYDLEVENPSVATLPFDQLFFAPGGDIGTFRGTATLVNVMKSERGDGESAGSGASSVSLRVMPSIEVSQLRSTDDDDGSCAPVTRATHAGANLALGLRLVGFEEATPDDPVTFHVGFFSPEVEVIYVAEDALGAGDDLFGIDLEGDDDILADAAEGQNTMSVTIERGDRVTLDPRDDATVVHVEPAVRIGGERRDEVVLGRLKAGRVAEAPIAIGSERPGPSRATFLIAAERRSGARVERTVSLDVYTPWEVLPYDQNQRLVEIYDPEVPSGSCGSCIPGGFNGREVTYTEGESISRDRRVSMRWDMSTANSLGLNFRAGPSFPLQWGFDINANQTWSSAFGLDVSTGVTSESHRGGTYHAFVVPSFYALCYRQLSRYEREVDVVYHNACGVSGVVGKAVLTDWGWGFDVAQGPECPPETTLPRAQQFD